MIKLAAALGGLMKPGRLMEYVCIVVVLLIAAWAFRTVYNAPKTVPPATVKYLEVRCAPVPAQFTSTRVPPYRAASGSGRCNRADAFAATSYGGAN